MAKSKTINIGHVRAYLTSLFGAEKKTLDKDKEMVDKYQKDTETLRHNIEKLKNWYIYTHYTVISNNGNI